MSESTLDRFILSPSSWTEKLDLVADYGRDAPLVLDIGCGKGRFLVSQASKHPELNFLGIDRQLVRLRKVSKKMVRQGADNVRLLRIEASYALSWLLPDASVKLAYVFFPDPWPKRRHHRRRLFSPVFLDTLLRVLMPDGEIYVATDHLPYFDEIHEIFSADERFLEIPPFVPDPDEQTEFEEIFLEQGKPIGRAGFRKKS